MNSGIVQFLADRGHGIDGDKPSAANETLCHMLDIRVTSFRQFCMGVACFLLEFVDLWKANGHQFESLFVGVEPAPFLQGVFKVKTQAQARFAVVVHVGSRRSEAALNVAGS